MKLLEYNIVHIADIHWGVVEPEIQKIQLYFLLTFLDQYREIDLLVIGGDFWDTKVPLNSPEGIGGINMFNMVYDKAIEVGIKAMRVVKGTEDHDNDQLEAFRDLERRSNGFLKIFNRTTSEETLPGLRCIYCPDETITNDEYMDRYHDIIMQGHDIGFFHGSFDVVFSEIVLQRKESMDIKNVIYKYDFWEKAIKGPMIAGHWHNGKRYNHLIYVGSPDRWAFNEEEPKGFGFIRYNTDTNEYFYRKIINPVAPDYITYEVYTNLCKSVDAYNTLIEEVNKKLNEYSNNPFKSVKIRIMIYVTDDSPDNDTYITSLRHRFVNDKRVKIRIKNTVKDKKKKEELKKHMEDRTKYAFISDKTMSVANKIHEYILIKYGENIPIDLIEEKINKYREGLK